MSFNRAMPLVVLIVLTGGAVPSAEPPTPPTPPAPPPLPSLQDKVTAGLHAGREAFAKGRYGEALVHFREALALQPDNRHAQLLAGVAAYWSREPGAALEYWDKLLPSAPKGSPEEWELTRQRIPALFALGRFEEGENSVARLYELRREKLGVAVAAKGFTREHLWDGTRRTGAWELFDERGEQARVWEFYVVETQGEKGEPKARLAVELVASAEGGAGYALIGPSGKAGLTATVYCRWPKRPAYLDVRARVADVLQGKLPPLPEAPAEAPAPEKPAAPAKAEPPGNSGTDRTSGLSPISPAATRREFSAEEKARMARPAGFKLPTGPTRILETAARLAEVQFDVGRFARLSLTDPPGARAFEAAALTGKYRWATEDATDLVRQITATPPAEAAAAFQRLEEVLEDARGDYARFALLTAINTRGGELPEAFLDACLKARDFVVRETAGLLLARAGERAGLKALFKELETAAAVEYGDEIARIVSYPLEELLGPVLGPCPATGNAEWRKNAAAWWKERGGQLEYVKDAAPGTPAWRERK